MEENEDLDEESEDDTMIGKGHQRHHHDHHDYHHHDHCHHPHHHYLEDIGTSKTEKSTGDDDHHLKH